MSEPKKNAPPLARTPTDGLWNALRAADESDLRVLLALLALGGDSPENASLLCEELSITKADYKASLKYWKGAGALSPSAKKTNKDTEQSTLTPAHRGGKLEGKTELPTYTSAELTALMEQRQNTASYIHEANQILGQMCNTHETGILVALVDYLGFEEAAVLILLSHMVSRGKTSLRYIEKFAFALHDEGITKATHLEEKLKAVEESEQLENQIRALFGMTGRALTTKEKNYLAAWIGKMGYDLEVIRMAYEITVDSTQKPTPAYANSILERWYTDGLRTPDEIRAHMDASKSKKTREGSFKTDEFFEAALQRSFDEFLK